VSPTPKDAPQGAESLRKPLGFPPLGFPPLGFPPLGFPPLGFPPLGFPPPGRCLRRYSVPFQAFEYLARGVTSGQVTVIVSYSSARLSS
jgi:hypothetical protein